MAVSTGQVVRVDLIGDFDGTEDVINVFHYRLNTGSVTDDAAVLDDLISLLEGLVTIIKALAATLTVWRRIRVQNLSTGLLIGERNFTAPITGTQTSAAAATGAAGLLSLKTNVPRVVMRKYFGPLAANQYANDGKLASGTVTVLNNAANYLLSPQIKANGTWQYGYLSPKAGEFVIPTSFASSALPAYQRRRRQGRGS